MDDPKPRPVPAPPTRPLKVNVKKPVIKRPSKPRPKSYSPDHLMDLPFMDNADLKQMRSDLQPEKKAEVKRVTRPFNKKRTQGEK